MRNPLYHAPKPYTAWKTGDPLPGMECGIDREPDGSPCNTSGDPDFVTCPRCREIVFALMEADSPRKPSCSARHLDYAGALEGSLPISRARAAYYLRAARSRRPGNARRIAPRRYEIADARLLIVTRPKGS